MTGTPQLRERLPFDPDAKLLQFMPRYRNGNVPRHLFRIHCPRSAGTTTTSYAKPPAASAAYLMPNKDIFKLPSDAAGNILHGHLDWKCNTSCNLISWTSFLLFALQYCPYKHSAQSTLFSEIQVMIIDTRKFPRGTFIQDLGLIEAIFPGRDTWPKARQNVYNLRKNGDGYARDFYFGEYLSQGDLDLGGRCAQASMDTLIGLGLFDLHDELRNEELWRYLATSVIGVQGPFRDPTHHEPTNGEAVDRAFNVASGAFGDEWAPAVALMLLALKPRRADDEVIIRRVAELCTYENIRSSLADSGVDGQRLPEVELYGHFVGGVLQHVETTEPPTDQRVRMTRIAESARRLAAALLDFASALDPEVERRMGELSISGTSV